ncbi:sterol carrier family protein [Catellatospora bangladeshensis]|uniref:sterol carrier family protein n=1 Tax=Catellatospora TaxID=53365 RepID=UPI001944817A|nr:MULTISPECIES: sterol carrier family protein [Catellatospora]
MSPSPDISPAVAEALDSLATGRVPERLTLRDAVRALLAHLATTAPGRSVEVRVPPYGAIQCVEGPRHTRGTPPNLVETDPVTFLQLAAGRVDWAAAVADGRIRASGIRSDIGALFPIV